MEAGPQSDPADLDGVPGDIVSELPARGEVWWCELLDIGGRPVVVLSRNAAIPRLRRTLVGPCTTRFRGLASEVVLELNAYPVPQRCTINLESVDKSQGLAWPASPTGWARALSRLDSGGI